MAKRGETRPWKVRYQWTVDGEAKSVNADAYSSEDEANMHADKIRGYGEFRSDAEVSVTVTYEPKKVSA